MKNKRKLLAMLLASAMLLGLVACGKTGSTSQPPSSASSGTDQSAPPDTTPDLAQDFDPNYPLNNQGGIGPAEGSDVGKAATTMSTRDASGYNGAVTSGKQESSEVGVEVLKNGGNAVDACVATALAVGFFEHNASEIGRASCRERVCQYV